MQFSVDAVAEGGTAHYEFFLRAGYGLDTETWGGNSWQRIQPFSAGNTVTHTFNKPGVYFLACHAERAGEDWSFGDPQTGIVVEVWPKQ